MKRTQTYQVVAPSAVTVEFPNGNVVSYPAGSMFEAYSTNTSVTRLMRQNLIRSVLPREIPNFKVDVQSNEKTAKAVVPPVSPLQAATAAAKKSVNKTNKPSGKE